MNKLLIIDEIPSIRLDESYRMTYKTYHYDLTCGIGTRRRFHQGNDNKNCKKNISEKFRVNKSKNLTSDSDELNDSSSSSSSD